MAFRAPLGRLARLCVHLQWFCGMQFVRYSRLRAAKASGWALRFTIAFVASFLPTSHFPLHDPISHHKPLGTHPKLHPLTSLPFPSLRPPPFQSTLPLPTSPQKQSRRLSEPSPPIPHTTPEKSLPHPETPPVRHVSILSSLPTSTTEPAPPSRARDPTARR